MARAGKPAKLLALEGKSHKTKAELEHRAKEEEALLTGKTLKAWPEVRGDQVARKEFNRLRQLLKIIEKDDALYEAIINRYCLLHSECFQIEEHIKRLTEEQERLIQSYEDDSIEHEMYFKTQIALGKQKLSWDGKLMEKRRMMLQIEKENVMTILSSLRAIPKKEPEVTGQSAMADYLHRKRSG
jgi:phage terminase small subunit